jgi:hypothetical protein
VHIYVACKISSIICINANKLTVLKNEVWTSVSELLAHCEGRKFWNVIKKVTSTYLQEVEAPTLFGTYCWLKEKIPLLYASMLIQITFFHIGYMILFVCCNWRWGVPIWSYISSELQPTGQIYKFQKNKLPAPISLKIKRIKISNVQKIEHL